MSNLMEFARSEMRAAGLYDADADYAGMIPEAVEEVVRVFDAQGHSGMSAPMVLGILEKLLRFEPLTPLTGEEEEWSEVSPGVWQNKRCSRVFRDANGKAYDIDGRVFVEPSGAAFTSPDSRVPVTFPYMPNTEYVRLAAPAAQQEGE